MGQKSFWEYAFMREQMRKKIRDGAAKVFAVQGFANTTVRDIGNSLKISPASIYYYFDSKEELLHLILDETISTGLILISEIERSERSLKEKLSEILKIHTQTAVDYNKMRLLVHEQNSLTLEHRRAIEEKQRNYVKHLIKILDDLKDKGEMIDLDRTVCAYAFFGMVSWAYRWYNPKGRIKPDQLAEIFKKIFTEGIYAPHE
jgi:AcrR family transcriptional regulator